MFLIFLNIRNESFALLIAIKEVTASGNMALSL